MQVRDLIRGSPTSIRPQDANGETNMNLSGILVVTQPENMTPVAQALNDLEGVEVFHTDPASGRFVIVQEAQSVNDEIAGLKRIKKLPNIIMAEMVHHYIGDVNQSISMEDIPDDLDEMTGLPTNVSSYLNG